MNEEKFSNFEHAMEWGREDINLIKDAKKLQNILTDVEIEYGDGSFNNALIKIIKPMFPFDKHITKLKNNSISNKKIGQCEKDIVERYVKFNSSGDKKEILRIYIYNRFSIYARKAFGME